MSLSFGLELRQEQKQVMSQRMIQSMEILQLSTQQLEERIDQELLDNPVLEQTEPHSGPEEQSEFERDPELPFDAKEDGTRGVDSQEHFQIAADFAQNYADTIDELPSRSQNWLERESERRDDLLANLSLSTETLQDHLTSQLAWFDFSPDVRELMDHIINNLDPSGYFSLELHDIFPSESTAANLALAEEALKAVQRLDPPGVAARNLEECLLLQIPPESPLEDVLRALILRHLKDIAANKLPQIVRETGFSMEKIQEAIAELRQFSPQPGAIFTGKAAAKIVPDVFVEKNEAGQYVVRLEAGRSQSLQINSEYQDMLKNRQTEKPTRDYLRQKIGSAQWLMDAIEQRQVTLLKVSQAIVDAQVDFFEKGAQALKPLKMQQIADVVGVHLTTVSRACDEKWMMTPQGVFPLKRFFSGALASADHEEGVTQDAVRQKIQEIIDQEDKSEPLSDEAIVGLLKEAGMTVARRTVVKYRQAMDIPSSHGRKEWLSF